MNKTINKIAELRDKPGWTNHRVSDDAGIGSATVQNYYPNIAKVIAITKLKRSQTFL